MTEPFMPAPAAPGLPRIGGELGPEPEDFRVDEVADREPSGTGQHRLVRFEKTRLNTRDAVLCIARVAGVRERDVGTAGMKDKYAVTTQWLSLPTQSVPPEEWPPLDGIRILEHALDDRKLRTGHLAGNRFRVLLVGCRPDAEADATRIAERLREHGMLNVFGAQRFGRGGANLAKALRWLSSGDASNRRASRFDQKLLPSVLQSEIFNRYTALRAEADLNRVLDGEVVRLNGTNTTFIVSDPAAEQARLSSRDIHLTGPLPGPKMRPARAAAAELEARVLADLGIEEATLRSLGRHAPGTRRDVVVIPQDLTVSHTPEGVQLSFFLPAGSYATEVLRAFTGAEFFANPKVPSPVAE